MDQASELDRTSPTASALVSISPSLHRMHRRGISTKPIIHLDTAVDDPNTLASPSSQSRFFEPDNPFLAPPSRAPRQSSSRQRQQQAQESYGDDNPFLSKPASHRRRAPAVPPSETDQRDHGNHADSAPSRGSSSVRRAEDTVDYSTATMDDFKSARKDLKTWEANFKTTHGRSATQDDIAKDKVMVKKYRAYGKLKKALEAKGTLAAPAQVSKSSRGTVGSTYPSNENDKGTRQQQTPTRRTRRSQADTITRTPTRTQEIEFVSPRNIAMMSPRNVGFMSPSRSAKRGDPSQFHSPIGSMTPRALMSPSRASRMKSPLRTVVPQSPSTQFIDRRQTKELTQRTALTSSSISQNEPTPSQLLRTPTRNGKSSQLFSSILQSPSRSRTSPLFGGMNNRRIKRPPRHTTQLPDIEDIERAPEPTLLRTDRSPRISMDDFATEALIKNAILSTPQKSGTAKMARSLFKSPGFSFPGSPSFPRRTLDPLFDSHERPQPSRGGIQANESKSSDRGNPFIQSPTRKRAPSPSKTTVDEAMDSMTIEDNSPTSSKSSQERIVQGMDNDDDWDYGDNEGLARDDTEEELLSLLKPGSGQELMSPGHTFATSTPKTSPVLSQPDSQTFTPKKTLSPILPRSFTTPRTPSQPSLTFSQPTPGSAKSDVDFLVVPPGFHSHFRRRQAPSTFLMASQEEDERFEREFLGLRRAKERKSTFDTTDHTSQAHGRKNGLVDSAENGNIRDTIGEDEWEETESGEEKNDLNAAQKPMPKKKYTQKRSTRLHRIAVAPSEKAEAAQAASKSSSRARRTSKSQTSKTSAKTTANDDEDQEHVERPAATETQPTDETAPSKVVQNTDEEPAPYGWGNANKPMIKSDRRVPGVGLGRAGPRRSAAIKFGGASDNGNYVAYNIQKNGFKKGSFRGKSRFGGSKFGGFNGAGGPGTGRTLFDNTSWRTEFDRDFNDETPAPTPADSGMAIDVEVEDDGLPWYGQVDDITDPFVVTIAREYLKPQFGDVDDPDEYVKSLEQQLCADGNESPGFRVNLRYILNKVWGYPSFRDGQLEAIKRILKRESTLLVLPTGSGKSLSYQLPAYIFSKLGVPNLTLVISPMISLMYDQVKCLPPALAGACWTSVEQSATQFKHFMEQLTSNAIKILFISPEKLQSQSFLSLVKTRRIPRIPFLCVDEVHCLSEWSHNFRPAYLLLNHVLKTDLKSPCVLGLTGTATEGTKDSICAMLEIDSTTGVLSGPVIRQNLAMTVSLEAEREVALLNLLQSPRFEAMDSILIYVMKQSQADALASFLRVRNFSAESYHAGKPPLDRQRIQNRFMNSGLQKRGDVASKIISGSGTGGLQSGIRILVATIAFGLGLNKSNIRSVIHYCMPKSLENYIQEIGRSGRDGKRAYCHMFLNQDDYLRLRSLTYADGMDWGTVLRLVKKLFSRKDIADTLPSPRGSSVKTSSGRKRRGTVEKGGDEDDEDSSHEGGSPSDARTKKRKQNDHQPLAVKAGSPSEKKMQSLVMSTSSILVIPPARDKTMTNNGHSKRLVVVREEMIEEEFDIKKEVLATLLSYVELDTSRPIKVQSSISAKCAVKFLKTPDELSEMADQVPLIDIILKQGVLTGHQPSGGGSSYGKTRRSAKIGLAGTTLSMAYCCDTMLLCQLVDITYTELVQELQLWKRKKWAVFELVDPALCIEILSEPANCMVEHRRQEREQQRIQAQENEDMDMDIDMEHMDSIANGERDRDEEEYGKDHDDFVILLTDRMYRKLCAVERVGVAKVDRVYELFQSVATPTWQQQAVFHPQLLGDHPDSDNSDVDQDDEGAESSEYDEDADPEYIQMQAKAKAKARASRSQRNGVRSDGATESELILQRGIQDYFAQTSGEGIGGTCAEEVFFQQQHQEDLSSSSSSSPTSPTPTSDRTMQFYTYQSPVVTALQRKWRSAVEVDLKVFLSQQWQQKYSGSSELEGGDRFVGESPRVVSRIFHGISSPCYPALEWSRHRYWAKYVHFDFGQLMLMADRIIKLQRQQRHSQQ